MCSLLVNPLPHWLTYELVTLSASSYVQFLIINGRQIRLVIIIIIIIIIKKGRQCKAKREWYTPCQSEDPSNTIPTYRQKEEKGKKSRTL